MKRRSKLLLGLGLVLLGVAALGWYAAEGHIPAVNRWGEQRLVAALRDAGLKSESVKLRELTWRRAVAGPIELSAPGLEVRASDATASLGWSVLRGRATPEIALRGLKVRVDLARLDELRTWLERGSGGKVVLDFAVEGGLLELRHGQLAREVPFAGRLEIADGKLSADAKLSAPELRAMLSLRPDRTLVFREVIVAPEAWRPLFAAASPATGEAIASWRIERAELSGETRFGTKGLELFNAKVVGAQVARRAGEREILAARVRTEINRTAAGWKFSATELEDLQGRVAGLTIAARSVTLRPEAAQWSCTLSGLSVAAPYAQGRGDAELQFVLSGDGKLQSAGGSFRFSEIARDALRTGAGVLNGHWDGADLKLDCSECDLLAPTPIGVRAFVARVSGLPEQRPAAEARAELTGEWATWLKPLGGEWSPSEFAVPVSLVASLAEGQESARIEAKLPAVSRRWKRDAVELAAESSLALSLTMDREFVSGKVAVQGTKFSAVAGERRVDAATADFAIKWPRVWWSALERWRKLPRAAAVQEILWAGDYDAALGGAEVRDGTRGLLAGANLRARVRGAEFSGETGGDFGVTAERAVWQGETVRDFRLQGVAGFDVARCEISAAHADSPLKATSVQTITWHDGLAVNGTVTLPEFTLAGAEDWTRWLPWTRGLEFTGKLSGEAETAWRPDTGGSVSVVLHWAGGTLRQAATGAVCEGIETTLTFPTVVPPSTAPAQKLTFTRAQLSGVELTRGSCEFSLSAAAKLQVAALGCDAFGGHLSATPFALELGAPKLETMLSGDALRLEQVLRLFPKLPVDARGTVSGAVPVTWADGKWRIGSGALDLVPGELGIVHLPEDFQPLTTGRKENSIGFRTLRRVENAILELHFNRLHVETYPVDAPGQSVRVRLVGAPAGREVVAPVSLDFNVNAPLEDFIDWSMKGDISLGGVH